MIVSATIFGLVGRAGRFFFARPDQVMSSMQATATRLPVDLAQIVAEAQLALEREVALAETDIKRRKAEAEMAIAAFKAREWETVERLKVQSRQCLPLGSRHVVQPGKDGGIWP